MNIHTRRLRSLNIDSGTHRRRVSECQAGAARLGGAEGANHALKTACWTLAVVLALSSSWVHAQTPTCAAVPPAPACNPVTSDGSFFNTAMGSAALAQLTTGRYNTASGADALAANTTGSYNTASGMSALTSNTDGEANTASGVEALQSNTTGGFNTSFGFAALATNTTGNNNTASGANALILNTTGNNNTALGANALILNTTGNNNTASGTNALFSNRIGSYNTASGMNALYYNSTGSNNTASGTNALLSNSIGYENTASGVQSLNSNTGGYHNTAAGFKAVFHNTGGVGNTGVGYFALFSNTTGVNNIGIGNNAGYAVNGSNNIDIGNQGFATDAGTIRIGAPSTQSKAFIAGIYGTPLTGSAVYVTSSGQLGVLGSSERFKTDIAPMPELSDRLKRLRPVTFRYKADPQAIRQYGLIAEEVDQVYPELVIRDEAGKIQGVRYEELAPMLLNEVQQQAAEIRDLKQQVTELNNLKLEMRAALVALKSKDPLVAQR
jgi:hypothetical protein